MLWASELQQRGRGPFYLPRGRWFLPTRHGWDISHCQESEYPHSVEYRHDENPHRQFRHSSQIMNSPSHIRFPFSGHKFTSAQLICAFVFGHVVDRGFIVFITLVSLGFLLLCQWSVLLFSVWHLFGVCFVWLCWDCFVLPPPPPGSFLYSRYLSPKSYFLQYLCHWCSQLFGPCWKICISKEILYQIKKNCRISVYSHWCTRIYPLICLFIASFL